MRFDPAKGIVVDGVVARQLAVHPVGPRPNRSLDSVAFNDLAGNTQLTMFLGELAPGGTKCGHRHFDETLMLFLTGSGRTQMHQSDDAAPVVTEWSACDLVVTPCNAWHQHHNASQEEPVRVLSFKSGTAFTRLVGPEAKDQLGAVRLRDRFDDEPDAFTRREVGPDGAVRTGRVPLLTEEAAPTDPRLGEGVGLRRYWMGGHRSLEAALVDLAAGGRTHAHRPFAEEAWYVISGAGSTRLWNDDGARHTVAWRAGDLLSPPLGTWRQHEAADQPARLLRVRVTVLQRLLNVEDRSALDAGLPDRFPAVAEPPDELGERASWVLSARA